MASLVPPARTSLAEHAVSLVGLGLIVLSLLYASRSGGPPETILLETLVPIVVGAALVWYGTSDGDRLETDRQGTIAACAIGCGLLATTTSIWAVYLQAIRTGTETGLGQPALTALSIGIAVGTGVGHLYTDFARHYRSHNRLARAVDASRDGIALFTDAEHTYVNEAYASMYDLETPDALTGRPWDEQYTNAARVKIEREVYPALESRSNWQGTLIGVRDDGTTFPQRVTISSLERGYVAVVRDVSEQRDREQRIQVLNRVLRHNLRNAFTVIQGHTNLIAERHDEVGSEHVEPIRQEIQNLLGTADKARGVERALARRSDRDLIEPPTAIRSVVDRATAAYPHATVRSQVEEMGAATTTVDGSVVDALNELVDNAVEHHHGSASVSDTDVDSAAQKTEPTVEVGVQTVTYESSARLEFTVADDGPGIPESERRAVLEGEETQLNHGSGLGLWLVSWLVTNAGGDVRFSDRVGGGSVVTLSFPLERTSVDNEPAEPPLLAH
ncbi:sensor histidine kinase [Natronosalvus vescus]|uniref:sensor histidine kinase n=1 Tax=Natronosalvus vescus TaxID=2953881 RepID=UPI00209101D4|nr:PAS domain-containing sensor histidine kinase [Natronosalvus vescus]